MGRHNRRRPDPASERPGTGAFGIAERISDDSGEWSVRRVAGSDSGKRYLCPGCNQDVLASSAHIVAWPEGWSTGVDDRRHWHTACWQARSRRT
ncbi:MAG: hypothetical protein WCP28_03000, partial [Actinomycetes bacterium]